MCSVSRYLVGPIVDLPKGKTTTKPQVGCPIRRSLDQSLFPAPQSLSQGITSFIASCCQGIHQTPFSRLIRSRDGQGSCRPFAARHALLRASRRSPGRKSYSFPASQPGKAMRHLVSVLDLEQNRLGTTLRASRSRPHSGEPTVLMFLFLHTVNHRPNGSDETTPLPRRCPIGSLVEPVGIEPTTPCLQSRCSPS